MNMRELAVKVAAREGGKKNLSIAQITEVLAIISDMIHEDGQKHVHLRELWDLLRKNGQRRAARKRRNFRKR